MLPESNAEIRSGLGLSTTDRDLPSTGGKPSMSKCALSGDKHKRNTMKKLNGKLVSHSKVYILEEKDPENRHIYGIVLQNPDWAGHGEPAWCGESCETYVSYCYYYELPQIIMLLPISEEQFLYNVKELKTIYPQPIEVAPGVTAWEYDAIHELRDRFTDTVIDEFSELFKKHGVTADLIQELLMEATVNPMIEDCIQAALENPMRTKEQTNVFPIK